MYHFDFAPVFANFDHLLQGAAVTLELSCGAMLVGLVISIICASAKTSHIAPLRWIVGVYVEAIRNTPFLIQIFFIYFGLPAIGISMNPNPAALLALVVNVGAYGTEIIRAGIESVQKGQTEAGVALGLKGSGVKARVHSVEPENFDGMKRSLVAGERVTAPGGALSIADALMSPFAGEIVFALAKGLLAPGLSVSDAELQNAMAFAAKELKLLVEPGGAAALAALLAGKIGVRGRSVALVLSGGNADFAVNLR